MAFVQRQSHVHEVAQEEGSLLTHQLVSLDRFEGAAGREQSLNESNDHHAHHHYREDGYGIATHVHDQEVHRHLFNWPQRQFPGLLDDQVALVRLLGHLAVVLSDRWIVARWRGVFAAFGHSPGRET